MRSPDGGAQSGPPGDAQGGTPERSLAALFFKESRHPVFRRVRILYHACLYLLGREATILISALAFSFLLSVFPLIVLLLTLSHVIGWTELRETIFDALHYVFPISQEFIVRNLRIYTRSVGQLQLVSAILLAWAGSTFFFALEAGLDSAYRVSRYRVFMHSQILGTMVAVAFGLAAFLCLVLIRAVQETFEPLAAGRALEIALGLLLSFGLIFALFLGAFYLLPHRKRRLRRVIPEAVAGTMLWMSVNLLFRYLAPGWSLQNIYGPFYVSITLLLWAYALGCVLLGSARLAADGFFARTPQPETEAESIPAPGAASSRGP